MVDPVLDTGHAYRVQKWTNRVLAVAVVFLSLVTMALAAVVVTLFPLKEVQPMLLTLSDRTEQVVRIEPLQVGAESWRLISEKMAREYVVKRETIDLQTEVERWQQVAFLSSVSVWQEFEGLMGRHNSSSPFERAKRERLTRAINIISASMLNARQLQVEFERIDYRAGQEEGRSQWVATMTIGFLPREVKYDQRYMNPVGFTVLAYGIQERRT